ncbi:hypothetical protein ACFWZ2_08695 [Streptomyces sp. NPDC059002]
MGRGLLSKGWRKEPDTAAPGGNWFAGRTWQGGHLPPSGALRSVNALA